MAALAISVVTRWCGALLVVYFGLMAVPAPAFAESMAPPTIATTCTKINSVVTCTCTGPMACRIMQDQQCKGGTSKCSGNTCRCEMKRSAALPGAAGPKAGAAIAGSGGN